MKHVVVAVAALLLSLAPPALAAPLATPPPPAGSGTPAVLAHRVDVNRAGIADLVTVPGIGERLAQAILELRGRKGSFATLNELLEVRGIGEKNLAVFSEHLAVVQAAPPPAPAKAAPAK